MRSYKGLQSNATLIAIIVIFIIWVLLNESFLMHLCIYAKQPGYILLLLLKNISVHISQGLHPEKALPSSVSYLVVTQRQSQEKLCTTAFPGIRSTLGKKRKEGETGLSESMPNKE